MKTLTAAFFAFALLLGFGGLSAQAADAVTEAEPPVASMDFSDADLQKFVTVQDALDGIREDYSKRLETIDDQDTAMQLQQEAGQLMVEAVQDEGLDVETYNTIAMALQMDESLRQRVEQMVN